MEIKQNRGLTIGIISGMIIFIIALIFIFYTNSDFDEHLILQVDEGVPADKLIPQIDKETQNMNAKAKKHLTDIINKKLDKNESIIYQKNYEAEIKTITQYDNIRRKFAKREISKDEFLKEIKIPKYAMNELYKY